MPSYTVFRMDDDMEPVTRRVLDQAFELMCETAGFTPRFTRDAQETTLTLTDKKPLAREIAPRTNHDPNPVQARRTLMKQTVDAGIWGVHAMPDADYAASIHRFEERQRANQRELQRAVQEKIVSIDVFDGDEARFEEPGPAKERR